MKKEFVVAIAGGGSTWTPGLLKALCKRKETFPLKRVVLFDNNPRKTNDYWKLQRFYLRKNIQI